MHSTGRRTTLKPGCEIDYERIHATIPEPIRAVLVRCGVIRWQIWRDGTKLFHAIDTRDGYDALLRELAAIGPVDPDWDQLIASLLDTGPGTDVILSHVWSMNDTQSEDGGV